MTAAPVALPFGGRNGVRVATVTFLAKTLPYWLCQDSSTVAPGNGPVPRTIAVGCFGIAIGVILSFCANVDTGIASRQNAMAALANARGLRDGLRCFTMRLKVMGVPVLTSSIALLWA